MSVAEYEQKFTELSQYALPIITEERDRCRKFEQGKPVGKDPRKGKRDPRPVQLANQRCHELSAYVLFDPSATHSFISAMYAPSIDRLVEPMPEELFIFTPLGDVIVVDRCYNHCEVLINGQNFYANLLPLELLEFDVILGMDFLRSKRLVAENLISTVKARKLLSKGCKAYLAHVMIAQGKELNPENILVVNEFRDVFPEELLGLPPDREVEFTIDLVLGINPISQAPLE
ncbi:uncharacterized protein LOC120081631 [Benincasa hispida]|uniref:uncharacterized protein LOC120081631 n=1 Tax=Benincasa hispida TaxID=102211 RepID=UPI0018FF9F8E|nr:uncharacterized protein LOC120081631 [Benincasa hispida]